MAAPHMRLTAAEHIEAIGMRVLRIAEDMASGSRHHKRSERLIEQAEQAAIDLRAAVRGRWPRPSIQMVRANPLACPGFDARLLRPDARSRKGRGGPLGPSPHLG
jgi:hypothetical protein